MVVAQQVDAPQRLEHAARVLALAAIDDGKELVGGGSDGSLVFWSREDARALRAAVVAKAHDDPVIAVACSPDGKRVATGCRGGVLRVWNVATKERVWESRRHTGAIEDVGFAPDGALLTASHDYTVRWWNAATGDEVRCVRHDAQVYSIAFGADTTLFTGGDDPGLRIWRLPAGEAVRFVPGVGNQFFTLATGAQGHLVAGGSTLKIYTQHDIPGSARVLRDRAHHGWIQCVGFAPDGRRFLSGGDDGVVRVWNVATGDEERAWKDHAGGVAAVLFVDGGKTVAAADDRGVALHRL
jgi:WD40 repeat protein